jgi:hypothetical protein
MGTRSLRSECSSARVRGVHLGTVLNSGTDPAGVPASLASGVVAAVTIFVALLCQLVALFIGVFVTSETAPRGCGFPCSSEAILRSLVVLLPEVVLLVGLALVGFRARGARRDNMLVLTAASTFAATVIVLLLVISHPALLRELPLF